MNWDFEPEKSRFGSPMISAKKQLFCFLMGWIGLQVIAVIIQIITATIFSAGTYLTPNQVVYVPGVQMMINTTTYLLLAVILTAITYIDLPKLLRSFAQYQSILAGVGCVLSIFAFNFIYGIIISFIPTPVTDNVNQTNVVNLQAMYPYLGLLIFGIVAPVCEELTYRTGLFSLLKRRSRALAYGVTIAVFALIHANFTLTNFANELLNLPYYAFAAFAFCFTYEKFGLAGSLTGHILNNLIAFLISIS